MKVLVNVLCKNKMDPQSLDEISKKCISDSHKVDINICDYTLAKNIKNEIPDSFKGKVTELDFEEFDNHEKALPAWISDGSYNAVLDIDHSIEPEPNFLDDLELSVFDDENYGCIYSDFYSKTKSGHKIYVHQKSFPLVNSSVPLIVFSASSFMKSESKENIKGHIISSMVSKHIPKALCSIENA
jgi:hypothetical protein